MNGSISSGIGLKNQWDFDDINIKIAVLIPCLSEVSTIAGVVHGFRLELLESAIYISDNNSTDGTAEVTKMPERILRAGFLQGKGYVVYRIFVDIAAE